MQVKNETAPRPELAQAFFSDADHGAMVMVNMLKFKDKATYPDGRDPELSGRDAYNRYGAGVVACVNGHDQVGFVVSPTGTFINGVNPMLDRPEGTSPYLPGMPPG